MFYYSFFGLSFFSRRNSMDGSGRCCCCYDYYNIYIFCCESQGDHLGLGNRIRRVASHLKEINTTSFLFF